MREPIKSTQDIIWSKMDRNNIKLANLVMKINTKQSKLLSIDGKVN